MKKQLLIMFFICALFSFSWAQTKTVTGVVTDGSGGTLPGVNVVVKGTTIGAITNIDGQYKLDVPTDKNTISFSFIGFLSQDVEINGQNKIDVELQADVIGIEEVVAVGYGTQRKSDVTGSVASVKSEELVKMNTATVVQAMQGKVAGVLVTSDTGSPGSPMTVTIRGRGTVGNSSPLYVVDGLPVNNINYLNSKDIASMEVLKDASATAIYGSRGANGVILITTNKAKAGDLSINIDAYYGVQSVWKEPELLNSEEWYDVINIANFNGGSDALELKPGADDLNHTTDWFDEVTRTAAIQDYNLRISGGTDKVKAVVSGNYFNQEGLIEGSDYERISARVNTEMKINDHVKIGENVAITSSKRSTIQEGDYFNGIVNSSLKLDPITPVYDEDGNFMSSPYTDVKNPVAHIAHTNNESKYLRIVGSAFAEINFLKDFTFRSNIGIDIAVTDGYDFEPTYFMATDEQNQVNNVYRSNSRTNMWNWANTLTYNKVFEKHSITAMAGIDAMESNSEWFSASKNNVPTNDPYLRYLSAAEGDENGMGSASGSASSYSMFSYLGRINYSYDDRYLLTANIRRDGSSKFGPGKRWGTFPSVALKWKVSNEEFFKNTFEGSILNRLNVRAGWGQIGNDKIALYQYSTTVSNSKQYGYVFGKDQKLVYGATLEGIGNEDIHWETTESTNIGLDLGLFDNKLSATFDWFNKQTKDMLLREPIPSFVGFTSAPYTNVGEVENKGFELALTFREQRGDFSYSISGNISHVKNKVINLVEVDFLSGGYVRIDNSTRTEEGGEIGAFYGYATDGLFQNQAEIDAHVGSDGNVLQPDAIPGDIRFRDIDGEPGLTANDRTFIGSPHPDFTYGLNIDLNYKNFDFSMFLQGVQGNDLYNFMIFETMNPGKTTNKYRDILGSWSGEGSTNEIPILNSKDQNDNFRVSDRYIEDGSYLRVKNVQLGYTLPATLVNKANIDNLRVYISAQNLFTFTNYSGMEPEIGYYDSLSSGIDEGIFPHARTISLGVNITL